MTLAPPDATHDWFINCHIEADFWLQVITNWDRGNYGSLNPEGAYHTLDDSLIVNVPIHLALPPDPPKIPKLHLA